MIDDILHKKSKKITVNQLQKICGFLNFLGRSILPSRAFMRWLYAALGGTDNKTVLKLHHHIRINLEMKADLMTWNTFLQHPSAYCRGFMDFSKTWEATEIMMFSDASRNEFLGFGAICQRSWMAEVWPKGYIKNFEPSIEYLELFGVVAAVVQWIDRFQNRSKYYSATMKVS